jgi:mannitol/fructose-specific phosphotransferase system IIA component (Ntr-type)
MKVFGAMHLASLLSSEQIIAQLQATDHWSAIEELVDCLVSNGKLAESSRASVIDGLRAREDSMSTGIGYGIAIPHTASDHVTDVIAAFGRAPAGIEFDSLDNRPVRFIVLFIVPSDQFHLHLRTLAAIARFLNEPGIGERLSMAADSGEILAIFRGAAARND